MEQTVGLRQDIKSNAASPTRRRRLTLNGRLHVGLTLLAIFVIGSFVLPFFTSVDPAAQGTYLKNLRITGDRPAALGAIEEALASVGLDYKDVREKYPNQFSGGELQRASIARALIPRPSMLVADEPVSMIDASRRMKIINLFLALKQQYKTSILYITHDLATAYYISDYIAVMHRGSIVEFGQAKQVLSQPQHSYTQLLLDSIPTLKHKWIRPPRGASSLNTN
jgi:ABC-type oligopeptide transport system ATPase subunit